MRGGRAVLQILAKADAGHHASSSGHVRHGRGGGRGLVARRLRRCGRSMHGAGGHEALRRVLLRGHAHGACGGARVRRHASRGGVRHRGGHASVRPGRRSAVHRTWVVGSAAHVVPVRSRCLHAHRVAGRTTCRAVHAVLLLLGHHVRDVVVRHHVAHRVHGRRARRRRVGAHTHGVAAHGGCRGCCRRRRVTADIRPCVHARRHAGLAARRCCRVHPGRVHGAHHACTAVGAARSGTRRHVRARTAHARRRSSVRATRAAVARATLLLTLVRTPGASAGGAARAGRATSALVLRTRRRRHSLCHSWLRCSGSNGRGRGHRLGLRGRRRHHHVRRSGGCARGGRSSSGGGCPSSSHGCLLLRFSQLLLLDIANILSGRGSRGFGLDRKVARQTGGCLMRRRSCSSGAWPTLLRLSRKPDDKGRVTWLGGHAPLAQVHAQRRCRSSRHGASGRRCGGHRRLHDGLH
mmetsp:Transcript_14660/g.46770  ORF Transcript_14660/g.46770 Transcript_14660/m.46770 type:complete len:465 (+) Transcript_14660:438-1832(+)